MDLKVLLENGKYYYDKIVMYLKVLYKCDKLYRYPQALSQLSAWSFTTDRCQQDQEVCRNCYKVHGPAFNKIA